MSLALQWNEFTLQHNYLEAHTYVKNGCLVMTDKKPISTLLMCMPVHVCVLYTGTVVELLGMVARTVVSQLWLMMLVVRYP